MSSDEKNKHTRLDLDEAGEEMEGLDGRQSVSHDQRNLI